MSEDQLTEELKKELTRKVWECRSYGLGRNATARLLGVSTYQIDKISEQEGIKWGGDHVAVANRARAEQAKTKRLDLAEKFRKVADLELEAILDGQDTLADRKHRAVIAGVSVDKDLAISAFMGDNGEAHDREEEGEKLTQMMAAIRAKHSGDDLDASD